MTTPPAAALASLPQRLEALNRRQKDSTGALVFTTVDGHPFGPGVRVQALRPAGRLSTGLPRIRLHDLRHTSASIGLASGSRCYQRLTPHNCERLRNSASSSAS
jgi:integrase